MSRLRNFPETICIGINIDNEFVIVSTDKHTIDILMKQKIGRLKRYNLQQFEPVKHVSRKAKTASTKVEKPPNSPSELQTPDDATDLPPKATGKPRKPRRTKAQIEAEKKAAGNPEPLYRCLNPYCPRKGKPFPDSEAKWEIKPSTGMTHVQCPDCESFDVVLNED